MNLYHDLRGSVPWRWCFFCYAIRAATFGSRVGGKGGGSGDGVSGSGGLVDWFHLFHVQWGGGYAFFHLVHVSFKGMTFVG